MTSLYGVTSSTKIEDQDLDFEYIGTRDHDKGYDQH